MIWFGVTAASVIVAGGVGGADAGGTASLAMWTSFSLAVAAATLAAASAASATRFDSAEAVASATAVAGVASASSSSSLLATPKSLANGFAGGRSLLATTVPTSMPAARAASSEVPDGAAPRVLISARATG